MTTTRGLIVLAMVGASGALLGAFFFQFVIGLAPCTLCYWQRYAHGAILATGALALALPGRITALVASSAAAISVGVAMFHTGVERKWWEGLQSCSTITEDLGALSATDLLSVESAPRVVPCDEIPWQMFGLSMANYNVALSLGLLALLLWAALERPAT